MNIATCAVRFLRGFRLRSNVISSENCFLQRNRPLPISHTRQLTSTLDEPSSAPDGPVLCEQLHSRGVVFVSGPDAFVFLQGIITNDMQHLQQNTGPKTASIYALMLNHQGRVLYDVIIYRLNANHEAKGPSFLVECDSQVTRDLYKHLNMFKIRKNVDIVQPSERFAMFALFSKSIASDDARECCFTKVLEPIDSDKLIASARDPRLTSLGLRVVVTEGTKVSDVVGTNVAISDCYAIRRYRYGIGEGVSDLPPGNCFPLECNADYLHGISFHKGCYIGQELTARTHHTGVVRKRLLPLEFESALKPRNVDADDELLVRNERGKVVGRIRGHRERFGLGLMRILECLHQPQKLFVKGTDDDADVEVKVRRPFWWPFEAPKENLATSKTS